MGICLCGSCGVAAWTGDVTSGIAIVQSFGACPRPESSLKCAHLALMHARPGVADFFPENGGIDRRKGAWGLACVHLQHARSLVHLSEFTELGAAA